MCHGVCASGLPRPPASGAVNARRDGQVLARLSGVRFTRLASRATEDRADGPGLDALGERIRSPGHGGPYDCFIPLSGGKDSTYILHSAVQDLGLTPIAINYAFVREGRMTKEEALDCPRSSPLLGAFRSSPLV